MAEALADWANPSSAHNEGRRARARLEDCRRRIAAALGWAGTVVFTSGATEALAIALTRTACDRRILSAVEHPAALRMAPDAPRLASKRDGTLDIESLAALCEGAERPLVCVQAVNNETGVIHPIEAVAEQVRGAGGALLVDCAQSAGKLALPQADMIAISAHKLGGPPGIGALLLGDEALVSAIGGQESGLRPGTHNLPAIAGFAAALEADKSGEADKSWFAGTRKLRTALEQRLVAAGAEIVASRCPRIPTIGAYRMPGVPAAAQLIHMDMAGIAVSAGSACASGSVRSGATLRAMGWPEGEAAEVIRVSFGWSTTLADIDAFVTAWTTLADRRRAA